MSETREWTRRDISDLQDARRAFEYDREIPSGGDQQELLVAFIDYIAQNSGLLADDEPDSKEPADAE